MELAHVAKEEKESSVPNQETAVADRDLDEETKWEMVRGLALAEIGK